MPVPSAFAVANQQDAGGNISEEAYWMLVQESLDAVNNLDEGQPADSIRSALESYAGRWDGITSIMLADGSKIIASGKFIASVLRKNDLPAARAALETLLAARPLDAPRYGPTDIESLSPILARSEFQWQEAKPNPIQEFINELRQKILDWLAKLFPDGGVNVDLSLLRYVFDALAGILFALVLFFILRYVYTGFITETTAQAGGEDESENLTAQVAMERAQTLSSAGDYRTAVRYLYLSALLLLDERGLLRYDRTKTNREYLRSMSTCPELAAPLGAVIDVFDRVWYGFETLDEQTYAQYRAHVESLKEQK